MHLSLFAKLRELERMGVLELEVNPDIHYFPGEGRYTFNKKKVEYLPDYTGQAPGESDIVFREPTDIAWCPSEGEMLAFASSHHEPFQPLTEPIKIRRLGEKAA